MNEKLELDFWSNATLRYISGIIKLQLSLLSQHKLQFIAAHHEHSRILRIGDVHQQGAILLFTPLNDRSLRI